MEAMIRAEGVRLSLGGKAILGGVDFSVPRGGFTCLLGPSGSGKTTLLRLIGGLLGGYEGTLQVAGTSPAEAWARMAFVFQNARLVPWKDVLGNLLLAVQLRFQRRAVAADRARALDLLRAVGLEEVAGRRPQTLSGGERQRVAIARALMVDPDIILMDEPMASLDVAAREHLRRLVLRLWQQTGKTIVLVTHDITEALVMGQELVVLGGKPARVRDRVAVDLPYPREGAGGGALWQSLAERVRAAFPDWAPDDGALRPPEPFLREEPAARGYPVA